MLDLEVIQILKAVKEGQTIVFYNWETKQEESYIKLKKASFETECFKDSNSKIVSSREIALMGYRVCDNILR